MSWEEEVVLHDGRSIVAERSQKLGGLPTFSSHERTADEEKWVFHFPGRSEPVVWKTGFCLPPKCKTLMLITADFVDGVPYLVTSPAGCLAYNYWGRPNPPYVLFKHTAGGWQRIGLDGLPEELKRSNVVVGRPDPKNRSGRLDPSKISEENRLLQLHLRRVLREPIKVGLTACTELVPDGNGAWISLSWFKRKPNLDACLRFCDRRNISEPYCLCEKYFKGDE